MDFDYYILMLSFFIMYLGGHCIGDYAFQSEYMALGKNKFLNKDNKDWYIILGAHASIHAVIVLVITFICLCISYTLGTIDYTDESIFNNEIFGKIIESSLNLAVFASIIEFFSHFIIDYKKCEGKYSFMIDQILHIIVKISFLIILF